MKRILLAAVLLLAGCVGRPMPDGAIKVAAQAVPLDARDPARVAVGRLRYMGGLALRSSDPRFGGLSGLRVREDGWALSVSDKGHWVAFRLVEEDGRLARIDSAHVAPLLDTLGQPLAADSDDAEALEWDTDGTAVVSFEGEHRLQVYRGVDPARRGGLTMAALSVRPTPQTSNWPANGGGEAYAAINEDGDVVIGEAATLGPDLHEAIAQFDGEIIRFAYRTPQGFEPTDAADLGRGELLVLHRRYSKESGVAASLALLDPAQLGDNPRKPIEGREIARLAPPLSIDNMEALAVRREGRRTFVYLLSDDNFSKLQRTLLLKFELMP